ncbi:OTUD3 [Symbiodinium natans]|uniref:OTUD3 protein n=1 Tax=Symbiodinium natans TaxID=878477 RepID=A0A812MH75_9DINO|nr:OTUD3 [Symbiodinium natans]
MAKAAKATGEEWPALCASAPSSSTKGWEREVRKDKELLRRCGLSVHEVASDGACSFRAFAHQLLGDELGHVKMRERCVDFMLAHRDEFEPFIAEEFHGYCSSSNASDGRFAV